MSSKSQAAIIWCLVPSLDTDTLLSISSSLSWFINDHLKATSLTSDSWANDSTFGSKPDEGGVESWKIRWHKSLTDNSVLPMLTLSPAGTEPCSQKNEESERRKHVAWLRKAFSNRFSAAYIATDSTFVVALCPPQGFLKVGHANLNVNLEGTTAVWCHAGLPTECCLSPFPQAMPLNIVRIYIYIYHTKYQTKSKQIPDIAHNFET